MALAVPVRERDRPGRLDRMVDVEVPVDQVAVELVLGGRRAVQLVLELRVSKGE